MSEQLDLLTSLLNGTIVSGASRFAECRRRVAQGCGGHYARGPVWCGLPVMQWHCCGECPHRAELNPWAAE